MSGARLPIRAGMPETCYPHGSCETQWCVCNVDDTGRLYHPVWFRTEREAESYESRQEGPTLRGRVRVPT